MTIKFTVPIKTVNEQNGNQGMSRNAVFAKNRKRDKVKAAFSLLTKACFTPSPRIVVHLTRVSAGELDDDGLRAALKSARDGIASALRIDDGSKLIKFEYHQRKCDRGEHSVEVEIA